MSANFGNNDISTSGSITANSITTDSITAATGNFTTSLEVTGSGRFVHADGDCGLIVEDGGGSGIHIGDCAFIGDSAYAGIKHSSHSGLLDYMLISNGTSTVLSGKDGYSTYVRAGGNDQTFQAAFNDLFFGIGSNADKFLITSSKFIANNGNLNLDLQVKGENDDNVLYVDANNDKLGIGTASPSYKLEVNGDIGLTDSGFYASLTGVMVGTSGWLYNDGQTTLSYGNFSDNGDAQNSSYVLRTSTTDDTFTTIQNNGSNVILASNRTMMFTANIVARRTNGQDNAAYKLEGVLVNDGYEASILGTPVKTILYESDSSWDVQAILSGGGAGASDYLLIQGKGAASKNINWVCKLDLLEVGGDISGYTEANTLNIDSDIILP